MTSKSTRSFVFLFICTALCFSLVTGCNRHDDDSSNTTPVVSGPDTTPPSTPQRFSITNDDDSLYFSWQSNSDDTSGYELFYSKTASPSVTIIDLGLVSDYTLHDLENGTDYSFRIRAYDTAGNKSDPSTEIIETPVDIRGPDSPTLFRLREESSEGSAKITLTWTNPTNRDFEGVRIMRKTGNFPSGPNDGTLIYQGSEETFEDDSITRGIFYYYKIFSFDEIPNYTTGSLGETARSGIVN